MARYTGPVCRICRRYGEKLMLKGEKCITKCTLEKRPTPRWADKQPRLGPLPGGVQGYWAYPSATVLQEAGLIESEKTGRTIVYRLVMSVLEETLLGFAQTFGWGPDSERTSRVADGKMSKRRVKGEA